MRCVVIVEGGEMLLQLEGGVELDFEESKVSPAVNRLTGRSGGQGRRMDKPRLMAPEVGQQPCQSSWLQDGYVAWNLR